MINKLIRYSEFKNGRFNFKLHPFTILHNKVTPHLSTDSIYWTETLVLKEVTRFEFRCVSNDSRTFNNFHFFKLILNKPLTGQKLGSPLPLIRNTNMV